MLTSSCCRETSDSANRGKKNTFRAFAPCIPKLVLAGKSKAEIKESIKTAMKKEELPALEAGAMCYMM
jgi:hypothetical protein